MLKEVLEEFLQIDGVNTAALISRDGFVIEIAGLSPVDADALAALGSSSVQFFDRGGYSEDLGPFRQLAVTYRDGIITFTPVTPEEFLVVISDSRSAITRVNVALERTGRKVVSAM